MDTLKIPPSSSSARPNAVNPKWWTAQSEAAWQRVRAALQRDWDQTKSDFSAPSGRQLNQSASDTLKQAAGTLSVPANGGASHPDTPEQAAKAQLHLLEQQYGASLKVAKANAQAETRQAQLAAQVFDQAARQHRAGKSKAPAATTPPVRTVRPMEDKTREELLTAEEHRKAALASLPQTAVHAVEDDQLVLDDAAAWMRVEPAARYGYSARARTSAAQTWDGAMEVDLRSEWDDLDMGQTWEQVRDDVRLGWNFADREAIVNEPPDLADIKHAPR